LAAPIAMPQMSGTGDPTSVSEFARRVVAFEALAQERISGMIARRQEIARHIDELVARSPDVLPAVVDHLDGIIGLFSGSIDQHKALLEPARIQIDQGIARFAAADKNGGRFLRKLQKRIFKAEISFLNSMIEHYYFFLALKADHDPDSRGGPSFGEPAELTAYLREQIEV
jgi:hypothetical protein